MQACVTKVLFPLTAVWSAPQLICCCCFARCDIPYVQQYAGRNWKLLFSCSEDEPTCIFLNESSFSFVTSSNSSWTFCLQCFLGLLGCIDLLKEISTYNIPPLRPSPWEVCSISISCRKETDLSPFCSFVWKSNFGNSYRRRCIATSNLIRSAGFWNIEVSQRLRVSKARTTPPHPNRTTCWNFLSQIIYKN